MIQMKSGGRLVLTSDTRSIVHRGEGAIRVFHCGTNIGNTKYNNKYIANVSQHGRLHCNMGLHVWVKNEV